MIKIYYNPNCTKCRQTLEILKESGQEFEGIKYLETPPSVEELELFLKTLGDGLIRKKQDEYQQYKDSDLSINEWAKILNQTPILMQRPLVIKGDQMIISRPADRIKTIL